MCVFEPVPTGKARVVQEEQRALAVGTCAQRRRVTSARMANCCRAPRTGRFALPSLPFPHAMSRGAGEEEIYVRVQHGYFQV